ncbi:MAG: hypothetical protein ACYSWS_06320 [Planctomycetota bacterium]|jgi:hypothetical protein
MFNKLCGFILIPTLLCAFGCATTIKEVNEGSKEAGKPAGQVLRIPNSVSEGVAEGITGKPESNPYNR